MQAGQILIITRNQNPENVKYYYLEMNKEQMRKKEKRQQLYADAELWSSVVARFASEAK